MKLSLKLVPYTATHPKLIKIRHRINKTTKASGRQRLPKHEPKSRPDEGRHMLPYKVKRVCLAEPLQAKPKSRNCENYVFATYRQKAEATQVGKKNRK